MILFFDLGATARINGCDVLDLDAVDLDAPEWAGDINNVTSVLKMWLRELPDPLLTLQLQHGFLEAASASFFVQSPSILHKSLTTRL